MDANSALPAYGLWSLVVINSLVFIIFAFSFFKPRTSRDWRSFGAFSGFLLQWPTLITLAMFPVLAFMYVRLARSEERMALAACGEEYRHYMQRTPGFAPFLGNRPGPIVDDDT